MNGRLNNDSGVIGVIGPYALASELNPSPKAVEMTVVIAPLTSDKCTLTLVHRSVARPTLQSITR
jgi:hypothetical protein